MRQFILLTLVLVIVSCTSGCASDRAVISQANQVHDGLKPAVMHDDELNQYLQAVGARIIAQGKKLDSKEYGPKSHKSEDNQWMFSNDVKFHFVNSTTLNAFTTGGEHMYIYNELFQQCKSEDELAAVMAHEYGHVYARHVHKGMNRQLGFAGAAAAAGVAGSLLGGEQYGSQYGPAFGDAAGALGGFLNSGYTRKDEAEADRLGFDFYTRAGWDPEKFGDFFQQMIDKGFDTTPEMMSDHPSLKSRVEGAKKMTEELPANAPKWRKEPVADAAAFKKLQARAVAVGKSMPQDKSMEGAEKLLAAFPNCITPVDQPGQPQARAEVQKAGKGKNR